MLDLLTIALEAHSDERNHHRRYELAVGRDLLGDWIVTVRYGRVGWPLRTLQLASPTVEAAQAVLRDRLRRRLSAPRRLGCRYDIRELIVAQETHAAGWLSASLLVGFLPQGLAAEAVAARG